MVLLLKRNKEGHLMHPISVTQRSLRFYKYGRDVKIVKVFSVLLETTLGRSNSNATSLLHTTTYIMEQTVWISRL